MCFCKEDEQPRRLVVISSRILVFSVKTRIRDDIQCRQYLLSLYGSLPPFLLTFSYLLLLILSVFLSRVGVYLCLRLFRGEEWGEKWRSSSSSGVEREVDRWARTRDGRRRWGEKTGAARVKKSGAETAEKQGDEKNEESPQEEESNGLKETGDHLSQEDKETTTLEEYTER